MVYRFPLRQKNGQSVSELSVRSTTVDIPESVGSLGGKGGNSPLLPLPKGS